ncbi:MAG: rhomboid family intramembrane serine protease [Caldisericia bacterium]
MIPLSDFYVNRTKKNRPIVTWTIIGLCAAVWLYQFFLSMGADMLQFNIFVYRFGAVPAEIIGRGLPSGYPTAPISPFITLITSIFLHGDWGHVIFNMLYLWVFGDNIEDRFGHFGFLLFYIAGGIVANLIHILFSLGVEASLVPVIGASGAIAAVMGAYLALYPTARIKTLVIMFFITFVSIPAYWYLLIWFGMQFFGLFGGGSGVAWWAHIGGFLFGYLIAYLYLKIKYPHLPAPWTVYFKKKSRNIYRGNRESGGDLGGFSYRSPDQNTYNDGRVDKPTEDSDYDIWKR